MKSRGMYDRQRRGETQTRSRSPAGAPAGAGQPMSVMVTQTLIRVDSHPIGSRVHRRVDLQLPAYSRLMDATARPLPARAGPAVPAAPDPPSAGLDSAPLVAVQGFAP